MSKVPFERPGRRTNSSTSGMIPGPTLSGHTRAVYKDRLYVKRVSNWSLCFRTEWCVFRLLLSLKRRHAPHWAFCLRVCGSHQMISDDGGIKCAGGKLSCINALCFTSNRPVLQCCPGLNDKEYAASRAITLFPICDKRIYFEACRCDGENCTVCLMLGDWARHRVSPCRSVY